MNKDFVKRLLSIAVPVTLQNLIASSLNLVDTIMIGSLGEGSIAAVGLANQFFFLFHLLIFGTLSGMTVFIAQFWGKKDLPNIHSTLGLGLTIALMGTAVFASLGWLAPHLVLGFYSKDPEVIRLGSQYLRIVVFCYLPTALSFAFGFSSRSIGNAKLPMIVSMIALGSNTLLNYCLIYGNFGFPQLGVQGAAIATAIARWMEFFLIIILMKRQGSPLLTKISAYFSYSKEFVLTVLKTSGPVIFNEFLWALGMTLHMVAYAHIGTQAVASIQIANTINGLFIVFGFGVANACAVILGNTLGEGKIEEAKQEGRWFLMIACSVGLVLGAVLFFSKPFALQFYTVQNDTLQIASGLLTVMAISMPLRMMNATTIVGVLRSGGDTRFALLVDVGSVWFVGTALAFFGAYILHWPIVWVFALVNLMEVTKTAVGLPRVLTNRWAKNLVDEL
ncbi:MATE family efflux transporter [Gottschalkiaceae bacterium SANA]|nr:MATE family efflux transporter [Gottschalkiaceae bacterium SANA]